ncbi:MAG: type II toxin-antitoxin system PemK/MazF family toxin [Clostridia bacterium]|nr:type II toxin-antitoxin system PemK/MazF family toxin [Clostridia bacterium]
MPSTTRNQEPQTAQTVRRGDIFYADLSPVVGSEQGGLRPVLIIQNDVGNRYSPTVIAAAITSRMGKTKLPTHIDVYADRVGLSKDSVILLEQIRTLDKRRLREKMGHLDEDVMAEVNNAIAVSFGLHEGLRRDEDTPHNHTDAPPIQAPPRIHHNPIADPRPAKSPQRVERPAAETPNVAAALDGGGRETRTEG